MSARPPRPRWLALLLVGAALAAPAGAEPPPEGTCPALTAQPGAGVGEDAVLTRIPEGATVAHDSLLALRHLLPDEVWQLRHAFFHDGMRLEIGACHRRYPTADVLRAGDRAVRGKGEARRRREPARLRRRPALPAGDDRPAGARRRHALGLEPGEALPRRGPDGEVPAGRLPEPHGRRADLRGLVLPAAVARARRSRRHRLHDPRRRREPVDLRRPLRRARGRPLPRLAPDPLARGGDAVHEPGPDLRLRTHACGRSAARRRPGSTASSRRATA